MSTRSASRVVAALPGKDVVIGEVGWPSEGRMREGALPSPANQARVIQDVLALAKQEHYRVNVIEAFDQPWKRALEGTVGGYWGLLDAATRDYKFVWGEAVSNHPRWKWQAAGGVAFVVLIFAAAFIARRGDVAPAVWLAVTANAIAGGALDRLEHRRCAAAKFRRRRLGALRRACRDRVADAAAGERGDDARHCRAAVLSRDRAARGARRRSAGACLPARC